MNHDGDECYVGDHVHGHHDDDDNDDEDHDGDEEALCTGSTKKMRSVRGQGSSWTGKHTPSFGQENKMSGAAWARATSRGISSRQGQSTRKKWRRRSQEPGIGLMTPAPLLRKQCYFARSCRSACHVESAVKADAGIEAGAPMPGISSFGASFRDRQLAECFVSDEGDIKQDDTFEYVMPCCLAHPRLCATRDADILAPVKAANKALQHKLACLPGGTFFLLGSQDQAEPVPLMLSHFRCSNPRVALFARCRFEATTCHMELA
eukprot:12419389-Karenia_brevis.AAC.1